MSRQRILGREPATVGVLVCISVLAIAEFERTIIQERVTAGLRAAKVKGTKLRRPDKLTKHLQTVRGLLAQGRGVRAIARDLGLPISSAHKLVREAERMTEG